MKNTHTLPSLILISLHSPSVLQLFLEQIVGGSLLWNSDYIPVESVTLFQFYSYLEKHHVTNLEKYLARFAKEGKQLTQEAWVGDLAAVTTLGGKPGMLDQSCFHQDVKFSVKCLQMLKHPQSWRHERCIVDPHGQLAEERDTVQSQNWLFRTSSSKIER